jgi:hypothetical protein
MYPAGVEPPPNQPSEVLPAAAKYLLAELSGPRTLAVAVSVAYVIRSTIEFRLSVPPPNQPSVVLPAAAKLCLVRLSGPRTLAVAVSVAYVIRCTVEREPGAPPPNQAAVFSGVGASVIVIPPEKDQPAVIVTPDIV